MLHWLRTRDDAATTYWRALLFAALVLRAGCAHVSGGTVADAPKNVIILFADGAASTQWEFGRYSSRYLRDVPFLATDVVMRKGALGLMSTYSSDALVTDSAAAATAMSTGYKTDNDRVSVLPDGRTPQTLMELAKATGKRIGLVSTAPIYDASPAAFTVHAASRRDAQAIVDAYLAFEPDVLMGGGADYFLPKSRAGGKRSDGRDVTDLFRQKGYDYARDVHELGRSGDRPLVALFAAEDMDAEIDRDPAQQPSLAQMASAALRVLSRRSRHGFVLFLENENVDNAGHRNDAAALMRELWAFDAAVKVALDFQREHPDTLILVTGDHETGGLSVTNALRDLRVSSHPKWFYASNTDLDRIARIDISLDRAAALIGRKPDGATVDRVVAAHFPGFVLDADLRAAILEQRLLERNFGYTTQSALSRMISRQTAIYWGTTGHTTQPALVGALGPGADRFRGYMDNTEFATRLKALLVPRSETAAAAR